MASASFEPSVGACVSTYRRGGRRGGGEYAQLVFSPQLHVPNRQWTFHHFTTVVLLHVGQTGQTCLLPSPDVTLLYRTLMLLPALASPFSGPPLSDRDDDAGRSACWMRLSRFFFPEALLSSAARAHEQPQQMGLLQ